AYFEKYLVLVTSRWLDGKDAAREKRLRKLASELNLKIAAVNEVHMHAAAKRKLQDVLAAIREGVTLNEAGHKLFSNAERWMKPPKVMQRLFEDWPQAISCSLEIANQCHFDLSQLRYRYPVEWIPQG